MLKKLKSVRRFAWFAVAVSSIGFGTAGGVIVGLRGIMPSSNSRSSPAVFTVKDTSNIGRAFRLTAHDGRVVDNATLAGRPYLVFFGFTNCPDVCPTTLSDLTDTMKELGPAGDNITTLFITVDPARDTQALLAQYMTSFDPRFLALRGSQAETDAAVRTFAAEARKVPLQGKEYTMQHTVGVYMMAADGNFLGMLDMHETREMRGEMLRRLAATGI